MKKTKKEKYVKICPKCKSTDINMDKSNPLQPAMGMPALYICGNCKHTGNFFPEIPLSELEEFETDDKNKPNTKKNETPLVDASYGNFEVRFLWKLYAPLTILLGIFMTTKEPISGIIVTLIGIIIFYIAYIKKRKIRKE